MSYFDQSTFLLSCKCKYGPAKTPIIPRQYLLDQTSLGRPSLEISHVGGYVWGTICQFTSPRQLPLTRGGNSENPFLLPPERLRERP